MGKDKGKQALFEYLNSLAILKVSEEALVRGNYISYKTATKNFPGINKRFIEKQTDVWLISFYRWLLERKNCWQNWYVLKTKPIFLDQQRHAVAAYNAHTGNPGIFVPLPGTENLKKQPLPVINQGLADAISTQSLLDHFNIRSYSEKDYIYCVIVPSFNQSKGTESKDIDCEKFKRLFDFYRHGTHGEQQELCTKLKSCKFLIAKDYTGKTHYNQKANQVYLLANTEIGLPNREEHDNYGNPLRYIDLPRYIKAVGKGNKQQLLEFLGAVGVRKNQKIIHYGTRLGTIKPPVVEINSKTNDEKLDNHIIGIRIGHTIPSNGPKGKKQQVKKKRKKNQKKHEKVAHFPFASLVRGMPDISVAGNIRAVHHGQVNHPVYGHGFIIGRDHLLDTEVICVQFTAKQLWFKKKMAFKYKELTK